MTVKVFVGDVDGVLTTGHFVYSADGKTHKVFGPDDHDALKLLAKHVEVRFISGDRSGFSISQRRVVNDMGFALDLVGTTARLEWLAERYELSEVIYMGDGIFDHLVFSKVGYSIAPANADPLARETAAFVTKRTGGDRAVAEACIHLLDRFFDFRLGSKPAASP
jgi:3-deoxy-D-manno-octulosonate 8-phosphate phosphatase (KDO 8-P phosphatase)